MADLICPVKQGCPVKKFCVFVEIRPCHLVDVVSKPLNDMPLTSSSVDDAFMHQTIDDTIFDAKYVGLTLLSNVKPENLFFFFGETVKSLKFAFMNFHAERSIPYNAHDYFAPDYREDGQRCDEGDAEPLGIILYKVMNADALRRALGKEKDDCAEQTDCCEVSWSDLKNFKKVL